MTDDLQHRLSSPASVLSTSSGTPIRLNKLALALPLVQKLVLIGAFILFTSGCENFLKKKPTPVVQSTSTEQKIELPSSAPIIKAKESDVVYAQKTLNSLGFKLGTVDGIWGPKSARAIRVFERKYGLNSANGLLSELNLYMLEKVSNTSRQPLFSTEKKSQGDIEEKPAIARSLPKTPKLIILDKPLPMLAKPNPFSEEIAKLNVGTGIYIIGLNEGWYEVESENKLRGFIKAK